MTQKHKIPLVKWCGKLLAGLMAGTALMLWAYMLPTEPMRENVARSSSLFDLEGTYPELVKGYSYTRLDNFTDSIMLGAAIYDGEEPLTEQAMQNFHIDSMELPPVLALTNYANQVTAYEYYKVAYGRYWHGYLVPLKLLLLVFDYGDIRILNFFLQNFLLCIVLGMLVRTEKKKYTPAYLAAVFTLNPLTTALSLQFSAVYYIILISSLCMIRAGREGKAEDGRTDNLFFFTGMATSYFDFLTYPIAGAGILLVLYLNLQEGRIDKRQIKAGIKKLLLWGFGYGGMWAGKWLIGSLLTGTDFFRNAWEQSLFRTSAENCTRIGAVCKNIGVFLKWPFLLVFLTMAFCYFMKFRKANKLRKFLWHKEKTAVCAYMAVACLPVGWLCIMTNHSWEHYWFTFRTFSVTCFAVGSLVHHCINS